MNASAAFAFGDVGRNTIYGPGRQTLDLALQREFGMTETIKLQVRAAFNALNTLIWELTIAS